MLKNKNGRWEYSWVCALVRRKERKSPSQKGFLFVAIEKLTGTDHVFFKKNYAVKN